MSLFCVYNIVMYRNLYRKSSFPSCPYTVLVKCPVRFYCIFDEIGQNIDGRMYFYHKSHCSIERQRFQLIHGSLAPANAYAQTTFFSSETRAQLFESRSTLILDEKLTEVFISLVNFFFFFLELLLSQR